MQAHFKKHLLQFKIPAQTSRGSYTEKEVYLLHLSDNATEAIAEASPLPGLSVDTMAGMHDKLTEVCTYINGRKKLEEIYEDLQLQKFPSIQFALECAVERLKYKQENIFFSSAFTEKKTGIPINGLVWMADAESMWQQVEVRINDGYTCIKLKIGALDFDEECRLLERVRKRYSAHKITLRVDANGAFAIEDAIEKLNDLKRFELHSIEQPVKAKQYEMMQQLCRQVVLPIALDEELIGINIPDEGEKLLKYIKPKYLILKPTLLGGFRNCDTWIRFSSKHNIGWWVTSALESNIGLNAIAQYCGALNVSIPQGLGTGSLYANNFKEQTEIRNGVLYYIE